MDNQERAWQIHFRLLDLYGEPAWRPHRSGIDELILTILSANTNDINSGRAFDELIHRFDHDWDAVRNAPLDEIKDAIRVAGMYNQKAPRIVNTLARLKAERGDYDLGFLGEMPVDEALDYLTGYSGIGKKTASIVLLFIYDMPTFPVDTHIQRISQRVGITERRASPDRVKEAWESYMTGETYFSLHINLITHGRETCQARKPQCQRCVLQTLCDYYAESGTKRATD